MSSATGSSPNDQIDADSEFRALFEKTRRLLAKYDPVDVALAVAPKLRQLEAQPPTSWGGWLPWSLMLLVRWAFEYGGLEAHTREVSPRVLRRLMEVLSHLDDLPHMHLIQSDSTWGVTSMLRAKAFQQFWWQRRLLRWQIARQHILFCGLPESDPIQTHFADEFGLSMHEHFDMCLCVWAWLMERPGSTMISPPQLFSNLPYSAERVGRFLQSISLRPSEVKGFLESQRSAIKNPFYQVVERTPFVRYPLLDLGGRYLVYSKRVFEAAIGRVFYETTKASPEGVLAGRFGGIVERYVQHCLSSVGLKFYDEGELSRQMPGHKITDFAIPCQDCTVLMDVKSVELRSTVKVHPDPASLRRELKNSVVKAVVQGVSVASAVKSGLLELEPPCPPDFYLLIVTYDDRYLGPGEEAWEQVLREGVASRVGNLSADPGLIPPERIIILSIGELDALLSVVSSGMATVSKILFDAVQADREIGTRKWSFIQHLGPYLDQKPSLPYLDKEFECIMNGLVKLVRHNRAGPGWAPRLVL